MTTAALVVLLAAVVPLAFLPRLSLDPGLYVGLLAVASAAYVGLVCAASRPFPRGFWFRGRGLLAGALLLRLGPFLSEPYLSDDVHRYLWEGRVQRAGFSPYRFRPDAPELVPLRDATYRSLGHRDVPAAYPPVAQLFFRSTPGGLQGWKCVILAADLAVLAVLLGLLRDRGKPAALAAVYAYHPVVALEFCGSAHLEVLAILGALLALWFLLRRRFLAAGVATGLACLVKPQGLVTAVPLFRQRRFLALGATLLAAALAALPFASSLRDLLHGLRVYADHWEFHGLLFPSFRFLLGSAKDVLERVPESSLALRPFLWIGWYLDPGRDARRLCFLVFALAGALIYRRCGTEPLRLTALLLAAFLASCPTVFPWYVLWLVPLWPFVPSPALLCLTLTAAGGGAVKVQELATGVWQESYWLRALHWVPPCLLGAAELWKARPRPADAGPP